MFGMMPMQPQGPPPDTAETVYISTLALLKMLKHARSGVPVEVMGLMLGEVVDDYTITVVDVFAMPQHGTGVYVEDVDPIFQQQMVDLLKRTGRPEMVVGWYHSHPGFGCWLSGIDINQQQNMEKQGERQVAVVVDPIQSMKGKIVIDCFRTNGGMGIMSDPRQQTGNQGHLRKPTTKAIVHGLGKQYYSLPVEFTRSEVDEMLLQNLQKQKWEDSLRPEMGARSEENMNSIDSMIDLVKKYNEDVRAESTDPKVRELQNVGKIDSKKHLKIEAEKVLGKNGVDLLGMYMDTVIF